MTSRACSELQDQRKDWAVYAPLLLRVAESCPQGTNSLHSRTELLSVLLANLRGAEEDTSVEKQRGAEA